MFKNKVQYLLSEELTFLSTHEKCANIIAITEAAHRKQLNYRRSIASSFLCRVSFVK